MNMHRVELDHDETGVPPEYRVRLWTPPRDLLVDEPLASGPLASWFVDDYLVGSGESLRNILAWIDEQETRGVVVELFIRTKETGRWTRILGTQPEDTFTEAIVPLTAIDHS